MEKNKPIVHVQLKSTGLNVDYSKQIQNVTRKLMEKLSDRYHVFVTPMGREGNETKVQSEGPVLNITIGSDTNVSEQLVKYREFVEGL